MPDPAGENPPPTSSDTPTDASWVGRIVALLAELREYAAYYLSARADRARGSIRRIALLAAFALLGLVAVAALLAAACALLLLGAAVGLGEALGGRIWLGALLVGLGFLAVVTAAGFIVYVRLVRSISESTRRKYEQKRAEQREQFGRDVEEAGKPDRG